MENGIQKLYDPTTVETKWYDWWDKNGYFRPEPDETKPHFSITIPPPNVTGSLHIGHALNHSIMDCLVRWHRMRGINTLCLPGTDHAGIATQNVVEKELRKEGINRHELGREKFIKRVWEWVDVYGDTIIKQMKSMGCSYDWSRKRFTLDSDYADAVGEVFTRWWDDGMLYIGKRVVNWCPRCLSVISDIEVANNEQNGKLWHIRYPFTDGSGFIIVATTRPETMLGDVAVAVNPEDDRYKPMVGKTILLPLVNREIPLIADPYPDPAFGSGAVKITPAHDANDYEVGSRHNLTMPVIMAMDGTIDTLELRGDINQNDNPYLIAYHKLDRNKAREAIVRDLEEQGFLEKIEPHKLVIGSCDRCKTVIEPLLSEQWFADMSNITKPAIDVVQQDKIRFFPERYKQIYLNWMENLRDWPISRQLWWGHQLPAYYCVECNPDNFIEGESECHIIKRDNPIVSKTEVKICPKCGGDKIVRDPCVLDTWFSSAIWPQTTLGWQKDTPELRSFYPTSVLTTAAEILYLWVARMIMSGMYFMNDIPFKDVYIHATVLDAHGHRMSKSKGNGVDPLDLIERFGADATRFALLHQAGSNQDIRFSEQRFELSRNFCNKIWNASRFVMMNLDEDFIANWDGSLPPADELETIDSWIISKFQKVSQDVNNWLNEYQMDDASRSIYEFVWNVYCDWYVEAVKPRLLGTDTAKRKTAQATLTWILERCLRLIHPFMPFITEEIWQALPHKGDTIMLADYPYQDEALIDDNAEKTMDLLMDATRAIRNLRAEVGITPGSKIPLVYTVPSTDFAGQALNQGSNLIQTFAWAEQLNQEKPDYSVKRIETTINGIDIYLPIEGIIDTEKEIARIQKEIQKLEVEIKRVQAKLRNPNFIDKAPADVVDKERAIEHDLLDRITKSSQRLKMFES